MSPLWLSLEVAFWALVLVLFVGLVLNFAMYCWKWSGKTLVDSILTLPLVLPPVVIGFGLLILFSPAYPIGQYLESIGWQIVFNKIGAILASAIVGFPLFYRTLRSSLDDVNKDIIDVARTLGASKGRIFFTIALPLAWRGFVTGAILSFSRGLGEFGATILIAGNIPGVTRTLPLAIYSSVEQGSYSEVGYYVVMICALSMSLLWSVHFLLDKKRKETLYYD